MTYFQLAHTIRLGVKSLLLHKLRSGLTILGIIFGVCSVIAMLSIGEGASHEAQERIKHLGSGNIILDSIKPSDEEEQREGILEYGLTYDDLERIRATVTGVEEIIPQRILNEPIRFGSVTETAQIIGTLETYQRISRMELIKGRFLCSLDLEKRRNVCVLTQGLAYSLFPYQDPLASSVKVKGLYFQVVGIVKEPGEQTGSKSNMKAYVPLSSLQSRLGSLVVKSSSGSFSAEKIELHKLIIRMADAPAVIAGEAQINNLMKHYHKQKDYKMTVPLQLLREAEETKRMFSAVLGSIAAISLIVGGIGIMNIMLATVTERMREIGLRRALGAKKSDIISQFMVEAVLLSLCGGIIGVVLGVSMAKGISHLSSIHAIVTPSSVILSFVISGMVGVIFGIYPAAKSAQLDPIEALRSE